LRQVLLANDDLATVCAELKQRCFERGAEDNLTAVVVCVGNAISAQERADKLDKTIQPDIDPFHSTADQQSPLEQTMMGARLNQPEAFVPASRIAFPADPSPANPSLEDTLETIPVEKKPEIIQPAPAPAKSGVERTMTRLFMIVLIFAAVAGAFYVGRKYKGSIPYLDQHQVAAEASPSPSPIPTPNASEDALLKFEKARREVDTNPNGWLTNRQSVAAPLDSQDPEFLYLYGRASLLSGKPEEAAKAFEASISQGNLNPALNPTLRTEAAFGLAAAALKSETARSTALKHFDEATKPAPQTPASSPLSSPSP
jgi:tetratricopeptide (TPR) repeat protein